MNEKDVAVNSLKAWILAARPKTLTSAAVPVLLGIALARGCMYEINVLPAVLCMLFAFLMQIDANLVNDYFDFMRGNDDETRLGPKRACAQGWVTCSAMRTGIAITTLLACACGLPLCWYGGWPMLLVGFCCVVFCFLYTTTFSYIGMGDVLVLVFFGLVPVCFTYYLVSPFPFDTFLPEVLVVAVACGLVVDALLIVNNYRDIDNDIRAGKVTLVVRLGKKTSLRLYLFLGIIAVLLIFLVELAAYYVCGVSHYMAAVLSAFYLIPHLFTWRKMKRIGAGRKLNEVLGDTARNILIFGLLTSLGLLL